MKTLILLCGCLWITLHSFAQSDFMLLKHKGITVATYFPGSYIHFSTTGGGTYEGSIQSIARDSFRLKEYRISQLPTQLGVYILDTTYYYHQIHYRQIAVIYKKGRHFDWSTSGAALLGGGGVLVVASGVVALVDNKKFSPGLMAAGAALGGIGYLLLRKDDSAMRIGKKYELQYMKQ